MPSVSTYRKLIKKGIQVDKNPYTSYDSLASPQDLEALYSVLNEFRDKNNAPAVITANAVMMNPDYNLIREHGFREYFGELFTKTLKRYPDHQESFRLWRQGMSDNIFYPQFHGREHLNVKAWLKALREGNQAIMTIFNEEMFYPVGLGISSSGVIIRAAFDAADTEEIESHKNIISDGLKQFEKLFGYQSKSFIAPNFVYHPDLNKTLSESHVSFIQGMKYQKLPIAGKKKRKMIRHFQGGKNDFGLYHLVRNCVFEPSQFAESHDSVGECLKGIQNAFLWKKPAVITAHRLNFIGYINPQNRQRNLKKFRELLKQILKKWPDAEFMTSVQLGELIEKSEKTKNE